MPAGSYPFSETSSPPRSPGGDVELLESEVWHPGTDSPSLAGLLKTALDESAWDSISRGLVLRRAGREDFVCNVSVALGNWASESAVPVLVEAISDSSPSVGGHAAEPWERSALLKQRRPAANPSGSASSRRAALIRALGVRSGEIVVRNLIEHASDSPQTLLLLVELLTRLGHQLICVVPPDGPGARTRSVRRPCRTALLALNTKTVEGKGTNAGNECAMKELSH